MMDPIWCVMPVLAGPDFTEAALSDLLAQSVPTRVLIVNQGVDDAFRDRLERLAEEHSTRVFVWHHQPPLPSLSATWNLALDVVWQLGGRVALVVNNDVRLHPDTVLMLQSELRRADALFVSAVGVTPEQFAAVETHSYTEAADRGGPDFSCFLIRWDCHQQFRFDERFVPAFCEDLDYHRRLLLAGEGKRIFSVNLPYLHLASQTLKTLPEKEAQQIRAAIESQSRAYYREKWGGPVNEETFWYPFDQKDQSGFPGYFMGCNGPSTPELQRVLQDRAPRSWDEQNEQAWADLAADGGLPEAQEAAERWVASNQQEDDRGEEAERSAAERSAEPAPPDAAVD